jgi:hypothetical protein
LYHLQHKFIGFYNRDKKCLQRGTDWVIKYSSLRFVFKGLKKGRRLWCVLQFARKHRKLYLTPLRPTASAHVAKVPTKVYTMFQRLSRNSLTKSGFNPWTIINSSVFKFSMHHFSTSQFGTHSLCAIPLPSLWSMKLHLNITQTFTSYRTANTLHLHYKV